MFVREGDKIIQVRPPEYLITQDSARIVLSDKYQVIEKGSSTYLKLLAHFKQNNRVRPIPKNSNNKL